MTFKVKLKDLVMYVSLARAAVIVEQETPGGDLSESLLVKSFACCGNALTYFLNLKALKSRPDFYEQVRSDFSSLNREY